MSEENKKKNTKKIIVKPKNQHKKIIFFSLNGIKIEQSLDF